MCINKSPNQPKHNPTIIVFAYCDELLEINIPNMPIATKAVAAIILHVSDFFVGSGQYALSYKGRNMKNKI